MKKVYLILSVIILIVVVLLGMFVYANCKTKEEYIYHFNECKERMAQFGNELLDHPEAQKCINAGGCFDPCSSCGPSKPTLNFFEIFEFYLGSKMCLTVCTPRCWYPIEHFR